MNRLAAAAVACGFALCACGAGATASTDRARPIVFAAASLSDVFPVIDQRPRYVFAGSDTLATQIHEGARADVFASASANYGLELYRQGLVSRPRVFATNRLVLIVSRSAGPIRSVADLRMRGVRIVIGARGVPVGDYTRKALQRMGALDLLRRVVSEESDVKEVVAKVALGEADAGFVYATDVKAVAGRVRVVEVPIAAQPRIEYTIAVVRAASHGAKARSFVGSVLGPAGRKVLTRAGFGVP